MFRRASAPLWMGIAGLGLLTAAALYPLPKSRFLPLWQPLMDGLHFPGAVLMYLVFFGVLANVKWRSFWAAMICLVAIVTLEVVQFWVGRSSSVEDIFWGGAGVGCSVLLCSCSGVWNYGVRLLLVIGFTAGLWPFLVVLEHLEVARTSLPTLFAPENEHLVKQWLPIKKEVLSVGSHSGESEKGGVDILSGESGWTGIYWDNPAVNLSEYQTICVEASAPKPITITIQADDSESRDRGSRYYQTLRLNSAELTQHCWPWQGWVSSRGNVLNTAQLMTIYLYSKRKTAPANGSEVLFRLGRLSLKP